MMKPEILLRSKRGDITDCSYFGSVYLSKEGRVVNYIGLEPDTSFFMRSLAKPLQSSVLFDYDIIDDIGLKPRELAIMAGSHAGSCSHIKILKNLLNKYKIKMSDIDIEPQAPLDTRRFSGRISKLHNNCSGKHIMMILLSRYLGFGIENYTDPNHPVQRLILNKQIQLSDYTSSKVSKDGCGTPLFDITAEGITKAYYNLITDKKYHFLINSILEYPNIFGGWDRLDSDIITISKSRLFSKVGAGGFVIVCNLQTKESLLIKMAQNNNYYRKLITFDILSKLGWLEVDSVEYEYNQKNEPVAKYYYEFNP